MNRLAAMFAVALSLSIATVATGRSFAAPSRATGCSAGVKKLKGEDVRVFCGPARATVTFAGKTYRFAGGICQKTPGTGLGQFAINIGIQELPPPTPPATPKFSYFGVALEQARAGVYRDQAVGVVVAGRRNLSPLSNRVTVSANLRKGTFTGTTNVFVKGQPPKRVRISGSWSCRR